MRIEVTIQGDSPLLVNRFTDSAALAVESRTSATVRGSNGTPREQAEPRLYRGRGGLAVIPGPNVFRALVDAGTFVKSGRRALTTARSSLVPAGIAILEIDCALLDHDGNRAAWEVDSRRVVVPSTGGAMMCHRPRFDAWRLSFTLDVDESMFDERTVRTLVDDAGKKIGLGDFRPARKGPFGRFRVIHWTVVKEATKLST